MDMNDNDYILRKESHTYTKDCYRQVTNVAQVLFSKDNLKSSDRTVTSSAQRGNLAKLQAYGIRPDGGRNEERGRAHKPGQANYIPQDNTNLKRQSHKYFGFEIS